MLSLSETGTLYNSHGSPQIGPHEAVLVRSARRGLPFNLNRPNHVGDSFMRADSWSGAKSLYRSRSFFKSTLAHKPPGRLRCKDEDSG